MYRVLYHGTDRVMLARLKTGLPKEIRISLGMDRNRLAELLEETNPQGLILPFVDPAPEDLLYLKSIVSIQRMPGVLVIARHMTPSQAVCCMRYGAYDCLIGPVTGEVVGASLNRMIRTEKPLGKSLFQGHSLAIQDLLDRLSKYSSQPHPVLIRGETGAGKDLAARTIHQQSHRQDGPFVAVNCAAYSDELLPAELFGSYRGAFTGSVDRAGLFEASHGGTLFLDEIGELSYQGQASLLRVLEERTVRRMGTHRTKAVDVRIIAATNRDLRTDMKHGRFRSDLFYRLNILGITIPPLRKRRQDIPELTRNYLNTLDSSQNWRIDSLALAKLVKYSWPGNVRELQSVILKASLTAVRGLIRAGDIYFN